MGTSSSSEICRLFSLVHWEIDLFSNRFGGMFDGEFAVLTSLPVEGQSPITSAMTAFL